MSNSTGTLSFKSGTSFYSVAFPQGGSMAAELVQYLGDIYQAESAEVGILKLLGFNLQLSDRHPKREADEWVEIDLEKKILGTNSRLIRAAVHQLKPKAKDPFTQYSLDRIYNVLDELDFTVELYR